MDNILDRKITYNQYEVITTKQVDMIIFVKTVNKHNGEFIWFVGFATKGDFLADVKRILNSDRKYPNKFFKEMFKDDKMALKIEPIPICLRKEIC